MTTSLTASTLPAKIGADADVLAGRLTAAVLAYTDTSLAPPTGDRVDRSFTVGGVRVQLTVQHGIATALVYDPDVAAKTADILRLRTHGYATNGTTGQEQHLWRGTVVGKQLVLAGRGRRAADLTGDTLTRLVTDLLGETDTRVLDVVA